MEDVLNSLKDAFSYIKFNSHNHTYINTKSNKRFGKSVTQYLGQFKKPFDSDYWSKKKAEERGVPVGVILKEWREKGDRSRMAGTSFHTMVEERLRNNQIVTNGVSEKLIKHFESFYTASSINLIPICSELVLGDEQLDIAGSCDQMYWSKKLNGLILFDWKTSEKLDKENKYQKMLSPFENLDDSGFNNYSLQLNLYRYIIEKNTNLTILNTYIGWFSEFNENYEVMKCLNLQNEIKKYLTTKREAIENINLF